LWRKDLLLGNDSESNETSTIARQRPARQWTGWKAMFSVVSAPMIADATMDTTMRSGVFYAIRSSDQTAVVVGATNNGA
jgi:hypothetical protein